MSTSQSLEDRARAYVLKWCNAIIRGDKATAALTDLLRAVDAAATERATEAARGEVERLRADIASQADGLSNYMDKVTQQAVDIQRLRERLAVELKRIEAAERLIVRCIPCVCPFPRTGCPSCNRACDACDYGAFAAAAATPAAPVTPADPTDVLTVSCPHGPEACGGCISAAVEGRPLPAVTPKGEPRAMNGLPPYESASTRSPFEAPPSEPQCEAPPAPLSTLVLEIECPHCHAKPGVTCRPADLEGKAGMVCAMRINKARALRDAKKPGGAPPSVSADVPRGPWRSK